jgi:polyadenylate-binding protein
MSIPATPYASASLYVGDLAPDVTEAVLFEIFNAVGPVASVRVCRDAATRRSLGYAYVNFHRVEDAERALDTMNFKPVRGRPCRIMWSHRDPSLRKSGVGNIFVKNLAEAIDNKSLYDTFSIFGNILSCKVATNSKGKSLGYGFVHYENEQSAAEAIARVSDKIIAGNQVIVTAFKSRSERDGNGRFKFTNVYVKNLPATVDEEGLKSMFSRYGTITSCMLGKNKDTNAPMGFGFVNFSHPDEAANCVAQENGREVEGKKLYVGKAQNRDEREKELKERYEIMKLERQRQWAGVNLYVKNLSDQIDDNRLREEFSRFGAITSCRVMVDEAKKSKGFGFVCFNSTEDATKAMAEMNGRMLDGKPLYVALAQRKDVRRQQLEAQYAARVKVGVGGPMAGQPQMYPGQPGPGPQPMGYYPGVPQRTFYQPHMMRQWGPAQGGPGAMMGPMSYQLMAINPRGGGSGRGGGGAARAAAARGGGPSVGRGGKQPQQMNGGPPVDQRQYARDQRVDMPQRQQDQSQTDDRLTISGLANAPESQRKQMIGERLFPLVKVLQPTNAGKITGMLLEMDNGELLHLLESNAALKEKVEEALQVLQEYAAQADAPHQQ